MTLDLRNLWVDTFAAFNGGTRERYNAVGYYNGDEHHDDTWVEIQRFKDTENEEAHAAFMALVERDRERSAMLDSLLADEGGRIWVICERFYSGSKLIDRPCSQDLWAREAGERRAKELTSCHAPRREYVARRATREELDRFTFMALVKDARRAAEG